MENTIIKIAHLTIILNAPRGVTRTAGANAYATKFAISPTITMKIKKEKTRKFQGQSANGQERKHYT